IRPPRVATLEGKENSKVSRPQILGKEKDCRVRIGLTEPIRTNFPQIESVDGSMQNIGSHLKLLDLTPRTKSLRLPEWRSEMKCERCLKDGAHAIYRVFTGIIDMKVCTACADEARKLRISVEPLD